METHLPPELVQFKQFLDTSQQGGSSFGSLDEAVDEFRRYQRELADLKEKLRVAEQQVEKGQVGPFDVDATMRHVRPIKSFH